MKSMFFVVALLGGFVLLAGETPSETVQAETDSMNQDVTAVSPITASDEMEKHLNAWADARGITFGQIDKQGKMYASACYPVSASVTSADFIKSRAMAFEKAYMKAIATLVMDSVGQQTTKQIREYFDDQSSDQLATPGNLSEARELMQKKVAALAEAKVDEALREAGVDPKEIEGKSLLAKRQLFKEAIIKQSVKQAFGDSYGIVPVNTFETYDTQGNYVIGVVVRSDIYSKEIGKCIALRKRPAISGKGKALREFIPQDPQKLMTQFGVRVVYDETGTPALISYGQWGSSYTGNNPRMAQRAMTTAKKQAQTIADEALTNFIRSRIAIRETSEKSEEEASEKLFKSDGSTSVEDTTSVIDRIFSSAKMEGSDAMSGRSTLKTVTLMHPSGHKIFMAVRVWTFGAHEANQAILNPQAENPGSDASSKKVGPESGSGCREGEEYDF